MANIDIYKRATQNRTVVRGHFARPFFPTPSPDDYRRGYIIRYFAKQRNNSRGVIVEVDKKQFDSHSNRSGGLQREFYNVVQLRWKLVGTLEQIQEDNASSVTNAEKTIRGITFKLGNLLQFANIS